MLDRDLAALYGVETRALNQAVRRNRERFPKDFMFSLTRKEIMNLSQFVISSGIKHAPNVFAFTEQGVAMLSLSIMRAFVKLKRAISARNVLRRTLEILHLKVDKHDRDIQDIFEAIHQLVKEPEPPPRRRIGFRP